jgi:hypothetical protein
LQYDSNVDSARPEACSSARNALTGSTGTPPTSVSRHGTNMSSLA